MYKIWGIFTHIHFQNADSSHINAFYRNDTARGHKEVVFLIWVRMQ